MESDKSPVQAIDRVVETLARCHSALFLTGAGISADSGLPTYRGIGGLYNVDETPEGMPIEELLSGDTMRRRPELTWKYLGQIEQACRGATFNRAHAVIVELERRLPRVWTATQNVDGFHRRAGSQNLLELHGNLHDLLCTGCGHRQTVEDYAGLAIPPRCPRCGGLVRPDVVLFGECLAEATLERYYLEMETGFDLVVAVGTTAVFPYILAPIAMANRMGIPTVEINPGTTRVSDLVDIRLPLRAAEALDAIGSRFAALHG